MKLPLGLSAKQLEEAVVDFVKKQGYVNPEMFPCIDVQFTRSKPTGTDKFITQATVIFSDECDTGVTAEEKAELAVEESEVELIEETPESFGVDEPSDSDSIFNEAEG